MSDARKGITTAVSAVRIFLTVLCGLATVLTVFSLVLRFTLLDEKNYTTVTQTAEFSPKMKAYVMEELESECLFYDLPFTVAEEALADVNMQTFVGEYAQSLYMALSTGTELQIPYWTEEPFVQAVQRFFDTLPDEQKPLDTQAAQTVGMELSDAALTILKAGVNDTFIQMGYRIFSHPLLTYMTNYGWLFAVVAVVCAGIGFVIAKHKRRFQLYIVSFTLGVASMIMFVPCWLLQRYDPASKLAIMDSPLKLYLDYILNAILSEAVRITGSCFVLATVLVMVGIVVQMFAQNTQNVHGCGIDEEA